MTLEFSSDGKPEGRNSVMLPAPDPDGRIRFLAPIPIERYEPGPARAEGHRAAGRRAAEEKVAFTLQP